MSHGMSASGPIVGKNEMDGRPIRSHYSRQLQELSQELLLLGNMVQKQIERSITALAERNCELAAAVVHQDWAIDDRSYELEERALLLLATQQPAATDLRSVAATLFIIGELERIGDYAEGIARIAIMVGKERPLKPLIDIPRMSRLVIDMLDRALAAFVARDLESCRRIWREDDLVDDLYNQVYRELLTFMLSDPATIERATRLLWAAHNLERIGDRVTNICERTAFVITGNPRALPGEGDVPAR